MAIEYLFQAYDSTIKNGNWENTTTEKAISLCEVNNDYFGVITEKHLIEDETAAMSDYRVHEWNIWHLFSKRNLAPNIKPIEKIEQRVGNVNEGILTRKDLMNVLGEKSYGSTIRECEQIILGDGKVYVSDGNLMLDRSANIEINFGASDWERKRNNYSKERYPGQIIWVPKDAFIEPFAGDCSEFEQYLPQVTVILDRPAITITKPGERSDVDFELILMWIEERNERIVICHRQWEESSYAYDSSYGGPFTLNEFCKNKILQACNLPKDKFTLNEVRKMHP